ncbi:MAG TPA: bifunctional transaldolase/phosoglucose isomerase [Vicinamibacterales bacterium]
MNPLRELGDLGQSLWLDFLSRSLLRRGELARLVDEDGLAGVTSNPTIFQKAMATGTDYDEQLRRLLAADPRTETGALFEAAALDDIRAAAAVLRPVFERTDGADGFVSFEVPASVANDTAATEYEARRIWKTLDLPNVMIKVPATAAGIPAIEELIADGVNVNITLMFSLEHYEQVAMAYIHGLERCANPTRVASVASFFVSRVDTMVDTALEAIGSPDALALRGCIAIANSKMVYQRFREIFYGAAFASLRVRGCRVQRPLWASTSTKNRAYRDVLYVEELIGPDTVDTVPPETIEAFRDHGHAKPTVDEDVSSARKALRQLRELGIDLGAITAKLQTDGVAAFGKSYDDLISALDGKRKALQAACVDRQVFALGSCQPGVDQRIERATRERLSSRIWANDHTVWSPTVVPELIDRLGWLTLPETMAAQAPALTAFADEIRREGTRHVVLLGMGGSSLAPEVFQATFGHRPEYPELVVLDSTHPDAVRGVEQRIDLGHSLFVVSSKSGGTSETTSFFRYFWSRYALDAAGRHFVAITDPGTSLETLARERGFRRVFNAPPDVGGRYSALTPFGLVPAALVGVDVAELLERARAMALASGSEVEGADNPALTLGVTLGAVALEGRDKVTLLASRSVALLPAWLEQLLAESTGKHGKGIVPIVDEPVRAPEDYGTDRVFVSIDVAGKADAALAATARALAEKGHPIISIILGAPIDLGQEFFRWEFATAVAGAVLGVQPFDQPDVQLAKDLARRAMDSSGGQRASVAPAAITDPSEWGEAVSRWLASVQPHDYIGLHAYLAPTGQVVDLLRQLRERLGRETGVATTLGIGPRFLHSTGQLHKGGPNSGLFLQLTDEPGSDLPVPGTSYTFGELIRAQAAGDAMALEQRGRRVLRINLGRDATAMLKQFVEMV